MRSLTRTQIRDVSAADFTNDVRNRAVLDMLPVLRNYLEEGSAALPSQNVVADIEFQYELSSILASFRDAIHDVQRGEIVTGFQNYTFTGADIVDDRLTFSSIGVSLRPRSASEFIVTKGGVDLVSSDPFTRASGDAILAPGIGIDFIDSWESDQKGILQVFSGAMSTLINVYLFRASSFTGADNKIANLAVLGTDQYGRTIANLPTVASQVVVRVGGTYRYLTDDYTFEIVDGAPIITFLNALEPDQSVVFTILS